MMNWTGIFPALTTKFTSQDTLDLSLFNTNLQLQIEAGVSGIILGGTLGESSTLTRKEKETLLTNTLNQVQGRIPVIINIAESSTREAVFLAGHYEKLGASALMLLPPMRYVSDHRETVTYYRTVAENTSLPIMVYNNPVDYKIEITLDMFSELADISNIQSVKESTRDVSNVTRMINQFGHRFHILCGVDTLALEELMLGASGWVAGLVCAFPHETVAIYNWVKAHNYEKAIEMYRWFLPLLELDIHHKLVQYIKLAETQLGMGSEYVRPPRLSLHGEEKNRIINLIQNQIKTRPNLI